MPDTRFKMKPRLFVSHPWAANTHHFALRLVQTLRDRGYIVWVDEQNMLPGQDILVRQAVGILSETDIFLFTLSEAALASPNCLKELETAQQAGRPLITLRLDHVTCPSELSTRINVDFTNPLYFAASIDCLTRGCDALHRIISVIDRLNDDNPELRSEAARLLNDMNASDSLGAVIAQVEREQDETVMYWLLVTAGGLARHRPELSPKVRALLHRYASVQSSLVQRATQEGLAALDG